MNNNWNKKSENPNSINSLKKEIYQVTNLSRNSGFEVSDLIRLMEVLELRKKNDLYCENKEKERKNFIALIEVSNRLANAIEKLEN